MRGTATRLAGDLFENISKVPGGKKFLDKGGKELAGQSIPGALITTALTTLSTGNPFAGLLVGGADLVTSTVLARALSTDKLRRGLKHVTGKDIDLGGGFDRALDATKVDKMTDTELRKYIASQPLKYRASGPQNLAMLSGSIGATLAIEPHFYRGQQQTPPNQQMTQMRYG